MCEHRGVRFKRIRDFKQYYFNSVPPTSRSGGGGGTSAEGGVSNAPKGNGIGATGSKNPGAY